MPTAQQVMMTYGGVSLCAALPGINTTNLRFDQVASCISGADGTQWGTWPDSSAAVDNLTRTPDANQVKKTNVINGYSVSRMNGGGGATLGTAISDQAFTYIAVIKASDLSVIRPLCGSATGSIEIRVETNGKITLLKSGVASIGTSTTGIGTSAFKTIGVTYSSPNVAFYLNGSADGTASSAQTFSANLSLFFTSSVDGTAFNGDMAEQLFWGSVLSGGDLTTVFNALRTRYGHY